jgi:hypothetical protein
MDDPLTPSAPRTRRLVPVLGAVVLIAIIVCGWWWYSSRSSFTGFPQELRTAVFLTPATSGIAYGVGEKGLVPLDSSGLSVREATRGAKHVVFVELSTSGLYSITVDGTTIATSSMPIQNLSLSPDGTKLAVAKQVKGAANSALTTDWHVFVYTIATKKASDIGVGFSPFFLGDAHLVYFAPKEVRFHDLGNGTDISAFGGTFPSVETKTYISPGRRAFGWEMNGHLELLSVDHISPPKLRLATEATSTPAATYTLGNTAFYEIHHSNGASEIWKRTGKNTTPVKVYTFPNGMDISRIAF